MKDTKSCYKYSDVILYTFYETTKQISFDCKLLPVTKVQVCLIYNVILHLTRYNRYSHNYQYQILKTAKLLKFVSFVVEFERNSKSVRLTTDENPNSPYPTSDPTANNYATGQAKQFLCIHGGTHHWHQRPPC